MPARRHRDTTPTLWTEPGQDREGLVATVAPIAPIDKEYTFAVPEEMADRLQPGQRVRIPLGRSGRLVTAFCLAVEPGSWSHTLKPIDSLVDPVSHLSGPLLELGRWIARHYACPLGRTLNALVPAAVHKQRGFKTVRRARLLVPVQQVVLGRRRVGPQQRSLLERLTVHAGAADVEQLLVESGASAGTLRSAVKHGWVEITTRRVPQPAPDFDRPPREPGFDLTNEQQAAIDAFAALIDEGRFGVGLLFGVSGCGKTEVYIQAMRRVLEAGRQVILLVPEIALTTQLVNRLACRFRNVAVIHSRLTGVQRSLTWTEIAGGRKRVVIGTRSAVFAPCADLGLIVVDEEQETSYKNLQAPRFGVRDVAVKRGQLEGIPVLLGSATPSLESWTNCDRVAHYRRIEITRRIGDLPMPKVHVVDMRDEYGEMGRAVLLSRLMDRQLADALGRGEQAILLMNRRGFATWIFCPRCKRGLECPHCNVSMVYHAASKVMICHYCGRREAPPEVCPEVSCGATLVRFGAGTQRVEQHLQQRFADKRIVRVDSDTMRDAPAYQRVIDDFEARRIDVLVGTQMIAKGLDFPHVSFVGVIGAEPAAAADFRAGERLFQLIIQVAGRAGRDRLRGQVVVQTAHPESEAINAAIRHDYRAFAEPEIELRRRFRLPPFTRLTRIVLAHAREEQVAGQADALADRVRATIAALELPATEVLGPQPCVFARLRGQYRYDLLLRSESAAHMQTLLDRLRAERTLRTRVKTLTVDVDPVSLA